MTQPAAIPSVEEKQRAHRFFAPVVLLLIAANIGADYLYTLFRDTAFYFSESALFSSYWILFLPLVLLQRRWMNAAKKWHRPLAITLLVIALHLVVYPALVNLLSALFYNHRFAYGQSFQFGLSAYLVQSLVIYGYSFTITILQKRTEPQHPTIEANIANTPTKPAAPVQSLLVKDSATTQILLAISDIHYFSASPPYVTVHLDRKKYLHTATLKGLEAELDAQVFVRIHRSCLLNIRKIASLQSRKNGDFDVTLTDQTVLRVSRNYAQHFRQQWLAQPQLSTK